MNRSFLTIAALLATLAAAAQSPYISRVYEYRPAPGQFVNKMPAYDEGDTAEDMARKAEECLAHDERVLITLGSYGGYVTFGFDHMVENHLGKMDLQILGNAFYSNANPNAGASREGGSCEPAIVLVSYDANDNGIPDDVWYELAGSDYRITYYRPDENKERTPNPEYAFINDTSYVRWVDNLGHTGHVYRNVYHHQSYYPQWLDEESLTFEGALLADNYVDESGTGSYYVQYAYAWGYADNHPHTDDRSKFTLEWSVDEAGQPVHLPGIHFVKVYCAVNQYCGWLGETSTEIMGAYDLHLLGDDTDDTTRVDCVESAALGPVSYYNLQGHSIAIPTTPGIYIEHSARGIRKVIVN